jgi:hypothetical protein
MGSEQSLSTTEDKSKIRKKVLDEWQPEENPAIIVPKDTPYNYESLICPKDSEGFIVSFQVHEVEGIKKFFDEYGLVVVRDILSKEECEKTEDEVWDYIKQSCYDANRYLVLISILFRNDPSTWQHNWPWGGKLGILGNLPILSPQAMKNRQNPKMHQVCF